MTPDLRVSVVMPVYNSERTVARAIDSVLQQTRPVHEIVVVDDGSADNSVSALERYGLAVTVYRKKNGGASDARNFGIEHSVGELIAFIDADDYWEPQKLERQVAVFERHGEVGLVCTMPFEEPPGEPRHQMLLNAREFDRPLVLSGAAVLLQATNTVTSTVVLRRSVLGADRFRTTLRTAEDRDLWIRLILRTSVYMLSECLATLVTEPGSLSRSDPGDDYANMLEVLHTYADLLSKRELRHREADVYRRWAGVQLNAGAGRLALGPALQCWQREPCSPAAALAVCRACALAGREILRNPRGSARPS